MDDIWGIWEVEGRVGLRFGNLEMGMKQGGRGLELAGAGEWD